MCYLLSESAQGVRTWQDKLIMLSTTVKVVGMLSGAELSEPVDTTPPKKPLSRQGELSAGTKEPSSWFTEKMGVFSPLIVMGETRSRRKGNTDKKGAACGLRPSFNVAIQSGFKSNWKLWTKEEAILRKFRVRSVDALDLAIRFACNCTSADDCAGWLHCAGYCLFWELP